MATGADGGALAAVGAGLLDEWADMGPTLWIATVVLALAWAGLLGLLTAATDPRRVRPGPATLALQGPEPPAVVNLVTTDWDLGHEAIPATLIDLAARRHLEIDLEGERTFVRLRPTRTPRAGDELTRYDDMVLGHVRRLAAQTSDGRVPSEALTTGPDETARRWWKDFRAAVADDARARGLSRARWSAGLKSVLVAAAVPVAVAAALAFSTIPDDPDDEYDATDKAGAVVMVGAFAFFGLSGVAASRTGERDTPAGREAAARWLGLRELLAEDPLFAEQPPAAVAIWDHLLAHGTALGVAHGVVRSLPLGAESEKEAWSSVGGRWRVVRVRYPRWFPPGYGLHPALVVLLGLVHLVFTAPVLGVVLAPQALLPAADGGRFGDLTADLDSAQRLGVSAVGIALLVVVGGATLRGAWMVLVGLADLVTGREAVEGRVLRKRVRTSDDKVFTHLAVDDGTGDRVRAWRFRRRVPEAPGQTVRAAVTRRLRHVRELAVVRPAPAGGVAVATAAPAATSPGVGAPGTRPLPEPVAQASGPFAALQEAAASGAVGGPLGRVVAQVAAAAAAATEAAQAAASSGPAGGPAGTSAATVGDHGPVAAGPAAGGTASPAAVPAPSPPSGPPAAPALPDDATVSAAAGWRFTRDPVAPPHPAALRGGSAIYRSERAAGGTGEGHVQVVWVPAATIEAFRRLPAEERGALPDLGDEAYRARFGGGVVVRAGGRVAMITPHLPDLDAEAREDVAVRIARAAIAPATAPVAAPGGGRGDAPGPGADPVDVGYDR